MYNMFLLKVLLRKEKNKPLKSIITILDATGKFKQLIAIRTRVDLAAYAMHVRMAIQTDTYGVPLEILLEALNGLKQKDLMSKKELKKLRLMPDMLTIYRGTDAGEYPPRISWSLLEGKARIFEHGQMYKAVIGKRDIYAYFCDGTDEEEVVAHVTDNFDDMF